MVDGVDLSAVEKLSQYKFEHENDKDVLEIYDDKMRGTQQSFNLKPPSSHISSKNEMDQIAHQSFYDGSGRYSNKTYDFVNLYLSQKPDYDSRRFEIFDRSDSSERYSQIHPINSYNGRLSPIQQYSSVLNIPTPSHSLSKSLSMAELNARIKNTINGSKRAYMM